jgi:hypothetical protein
MFSMSPVVIDIFCEYNNEYNKNYTEKWNKPVDPGSNGTTIVTCFMVRFLNKMNDYFVQINPIYRLFHTLLLPNQARSFVVK